MSGPKKLYWEQTIGGMGGAHDLLMADDGKYVGHFYADAREGVDIDAVMALVAAAPVLLAALKAMPSAKGTKDIEQHYRWLCEWHDEYVLPAIARATVQP